MKLRYTLYIILSLFVITACNDNVQGVMDDEDVKLITLDGSDLHSEIEPFEEVGEEGSRTTRVNLQGEQFEPNDLIRLRVIAPYVSSSEYGESTWGGSYDNWRLYTWGGEESNWGPVNGQKFHLDVDNDFAESNGNAPNAIIMPQATPFVFTATTFTEEIHHVLPSASSAGTVVLSFSNVFKADQRRPENYKASDVLWAQQYMQTGSDNVRLSFKHKMAALKIDVRDFASLLAEGSEEVVLTLENMPDIDQQEVTIGNYYANMMKDKRNYGDYYRTKCSYEDNGKVLGIVVPDEYLGHLEQIAFTDNRISQDGVYTAYKQDVNTFLLIIPPYTVPEGVTPTLWLRKGEKRWSAPLSLPKAEDGNGQTDRTFESGKRYNVTMKVPVVPDTQN